MSASSSTPRPFWVRLAFWLGLVAVFSALLAPVSLLAQDVQSGKLGGLCSVASTAATGALDASDGDSPSMGGHCELCGSTALGLPPLQHRGVLAAPVTAMATVVADAVRSASSPGLPFSRGPPAL